MKFDKNQIFIYNNYIRKAMRTTFLSLFIYLKEGNFMNKPTLIVMCGVPGAGKDYQIMNHKFFENLRANVVSRDAIRFNMLHTPAFRYVSVLRFKSNSEQISDQSLSIAPFFFLLI